VPVHYSDLPIDAVEIDMSLAVGGYAVDRERVNDGGVNYDNALFANRSRNGFTGEAFLVSGGACYLRP
jgi:hypothetical protein